MYNLVFGDMSFSIGWKTITDITLFGKEYNIIVKAKAYFEKDGVTDEQENSYRAFKDNKNDCIKLVEKLLKELISEDASIRFTPRVLLFQRNGEYALLLDDKDDEDGGVVVCLAPKVEVMFQDEYL